MLNNFKLTIQYDGANYAGWQLQKNAPSVQEKMIDAIEVILKERVNLIGSGRTDAGVHALGQIGNFRIDKQIDIEKFRYSLNAILPKDISVTQIENVHEDFHARFDASNRAYIYLFSNNKSPFFDNYSYHYSPVFKTDLNYLKKISKVLLGENDFTSFCIKNSEVENKICTINEINWRRTGDKLIFYISGNRFLHGMVRAIIGTLVYAAENNLNEDYISNVLKKQDRNEAAGSVPAKGLFLFKVRY